MVFKIACKVLDSRLIESSRNEALTREVRSEASQKHVLLHV